MCCGTVELNMFKDPQNPGFVETIFAFSVWIAFVVACSSVIAAAYWWLQFLLVPGS